MDRCKTFDYLQPSKTGARAAARRYLCSTGGRRRELGSGRGRVTMGEANPFEASLGRGPANHIPLSPLSFLPRAAAVYPGRCAVIHGPLRYTWAEVYERCRRLASALAKRGIGRGDTVAVMAPNTPPCLEAHFGVAAAGAMLNALNVRLDAATIGFILNHGEAKVLLTDREFSRSEEPTSELQALMRN